MQSNTVRRLRISRDIRDNIEAFLPGCTAGLNSVPWTRQPRFSSRKEKAAVAAANIKQLSRPLRRVDVTYEIRDSPIVAALNSRTVPSTMIILIEWRKIGRRLGRSSPTRNVATQYVESCPLAGWAFHFAQTHMELSGADRAPVGSWNLRLVGKPSNGYSRAGIPARLQAPGRFPNDGLHRSILIMRPALARSAPIHSPDRIFLNGNRPAMPARRWPARSAGGNPSGQA